jgi:hypothetical protein
MNMIAPGNYRSAWWLALFVSFLTVASAVTHGIGVQVTTGAIAFLDYAEFMPSLPLEQAKTIDSRQRLLGIIQLSVGLLEAVLFLMWVYRANKNGRALGAAGMKYDPGWSVGWFFVPIANLFMPYWVLKEIWQASSPTPHGGWRQTTVSPLLALWWLVSVICGTIRYSRWHYFKSEGPTAFALKFLSSWPEELSGHRPGLINSELEWCWGLMLGDVAGIAACILAIVVVLTITGLQDRKQAMILELQSVQEEELSPDTVEA